MLVGMSVCEFGYSARVASHLEVNCEVLDLCFLLCYFGFGGYDSRIDLGIVIGFLASIFKT